MTTVIFIGDPHFQVSNIVEVDLFIEKIVELCQEKQPDLIIVGGDLLHTHERLHTVALNRAYNLVDKLRTISKVYVLVGNHDYENNTQFLTENHWMNGMKEWANVIIVDKVVSTVIKDEKFIFVPYVYPGRFVEALSTLDEKIGWKDSSCIFAHQEFAGCKMGAIVSVDGDKWDINNPFVVSGHIHSKQSPQENIYYTGSAMQHAFGESDQNIIAYLTFENKKYIKEEIDLLLPRKKIVYMNAEDVEDYKPAETEDKIKVTVSGSYEQFKAFKKTKKYKEIIDKGVKVIFKPKKIEIANKVENIETKQKDSNEVNFRDILYGMINETKDPYLLHSYELVVNSKNINIEDIMFL